MKCETNFQDGVKKISETKRPGMVIIHKSTCNACIQLKPKLLGSKEIDRLSNFFVVISLLDDKESRNPKLNLDGKYVPRIFFLDLSGQKPYHERNMKCEFSLNLGLNKMRSSQQPGMVVIYKTWCPVCSELKTSIGSSREVNYLSNYMVIMMLKDDNEPKDAAFAPDGSYIPRILFLSPTGNILYDVINQKGDPRYKYFYTNENELIYNMRRVINFFPSRQ